MLLLLIECIQILVLSLFLNSRLVSSHGMLLEPPNRSSLWRFREFDRYEPETNHNDNRLWCGGFRIQHKLNSGKCGVCGDNWADPEPRENEDNGIYGKGIIVRKYKPGQTIKVSVNLTTSHRGYMQFRICSKKSHKHPAADQSCFDENLLKLDENYGHVGDKVFVKEEGTSVQITRFLKLPPNLLCKHCILQWHYKTGNTWGICPDMKGRKGCGNQETFRGCADISIWSKKWTQNRLVQKPPKYFEKFE